MKNFWLDHKGPKTTKINIWLSASVTEGEEELMETVEVVVPKTEVSFLRGLREGEKGVYDVQKYNPFTAVSEETDKMLWNLRVGKALVQRKELGLFSGHSISKEVMNAQWTPGEGNKLWKQGTGEYMTFYIKEEKPDPRTQGSCGTVLNPTVKKQ